jgi:hypothetical protein
MTRRSAVLPDAAPPAGRLARAPSLPPVRGDGGAAQRPGPDPLLAACRLVGQGEIAFHTPPGDGGRAHTLNEICVASQVRHRRVRLRGDWWRRDHGALLAFRRVGVDGAGAPVALLPRGPHRYELVDPADGSRTGVDSAVAAALAPQAFVFHAPLPRRALDSRDLLRRLVRGSRRDLLVLALVGMAGGVVGLVVPLVVARVVGSAIPHGDPAQLACLTAALFAAALSAALFQVVRAVAVLRIGARLDGSLQGAVFDHLLRSPSPSSGASAWATCMRAPWGWSRSAASSRVRSSRRSCRWRSRCSASPSSSTTARSSPAPPRCWWRCCARRRWRWRACSCTGSGRCTRRRAGWPPSSSTSWEASSSCAWPAPSGAPRRGGRAHTPCSAGARTGRSAWRTCRRW